MFSYYKDIACWCNGIYCSAASSFISGERLLCSLQGQRNFTMSHTTSPILIHGMPWLEGERQGPIRISTDHEKPFKVERKWMSPHRKDYYLFQYVTKGHGRHWVDMLPYDYKQNTFYFSSPEQVHVKEEVSTLGTVITFTKEFLAMEQNKGLDMLPIILNKYHAHELKISDTNQSELNSILEKCANEYRQDNDLKTEMLNAGMRLLLVFLSRIYNEQYSDSEPNQQRNFYRRFQSSLEENFSKTHQATYYSRLLHISVSHLNLLIKAQSGKTITRHIHERLVLEAKRLLFSTDYTVQQIAFRLGFRDASYFNRFFKKATSLTPLQYRHEIGE